jgi:hypothetical protein
VCLRRAERSEGRGEGARRRRGEGERRRRGSSPELISRLLRRAPLTRAYRIVRIVMASPSASAESIERSWTPIAIRIGMTRFYALPQVCIIIRILAAYRDDGFDSRRSEMFAECLDCFFNGMRHRGSNFFLVRRECVTSD